jgi:hypothetical protein
MPQVIENDPLDPKKIYDDLVNRCKKAKVYEIQCIVEEWWTGPAPFSIMIIDGVYFCYVIAISKRDAFLEVANKLPVIKFLTKQDDYDE